MWASLDWSPRQVISIEARDDRLTIVVRGTTYEWSELTEQQRPTPGMTGTTPQLPITTPIRTFIEYGEPDIRAEEDEEEEESGPPVLENFQANLHLAPAPIIQFGENGQLRVSGMSDNQRLDITVTGQFGGPEAHEGHLEITIAPSRIDVVDEHPITIGNMSLRQGELTLSQITGNVDFQGFVPGHVDGTIESATLRGAQIQFDNGEETE